MQVKACRTIERCVSSDDDAEKVLALLIPLFPLDVVLFPGTPLPLHIFEPRYKEMIGECLGKDTVFGVVRAMDQGFANVGCTAEVITVTREYPDGRLDIVTEGRQRFEVKDINRERSFLRGNVEMIEDSAEPPLSEDRDRATKLHAQILSMAGAVQDLSSADQEKLSFYLAGSLPLDLDFKQNLLAARSEAERLSALISYLELLIPKLQNASRVRDLARGNGHAH